MKSFPFYFQSNQMDCGPTCLRMIAKYYGKNFYLRQMKNWSRVMREGSSMLDIMDAATNMGIKSTGLKIDLERLKLVDLPAILHWDQQHFVVLFKIQNNLYFIADPAIGILQLNELDFLSHWQNHERGYHHVGILLTISVAY
ncbi:cysteine peptidase family C39 domain-containing protein [Pedobacter gandavensis]|uniref:cysteine peptidase family C39 domain-containing protein n=1 Tax=Pedobacter gandavensis TaxID=2679963 RepID=UPI0024789CD9|nr:cysteine peptidase family C39 domain-containing protein [Pedobacter gandavensis]WGQ10178.1 cysteine peptidase family C39 domain-containing protein [Pedobacter gandavensis]